MLRIACDHTERVLEPGGDGPISHMEQCSNEAEMVVLLGGYSDDEVYIPAQYSGYCSDHAPEGAHEIRQSFNDDEYRVVVLSKGE